ncbi:MAG: lamin tail domain-containing protein [Planctomycetota bacterium]
MNTFPRFIHYILFSICSLFVAAAPAAAQGSVRINEFLASNSGGLLDKDLQASDWIEIANDGSTAVNLAGWRLTDDASNLNKWAFPNISIPANGFLIVFASGKNISASGQELHTNFSLSAGGEYLALVAPGGSIATEFAPSFPKQIANVSYGFPVPFNGAAGYFETSTPGAQNAGTTYALVDNVTFSHDRSFYYSNFSLTLSCATPGAVIRFTLDGREPSATLGNIYSQPISISETVHVRAIALLPATPSIAISTTSTYIFISSFLAQTQAGAVTKGFPSKWVEMDGTKWTQGLNGTHPGSSYGYDPILYSQYTSADLETALLAVPSVSLVMPINDWFGYNPPAGPFGIYVNSEQSTDDWDRKVSAEWIDPAGGPEFQINCGIGIQGASSTTEDLRSQLSMMLKFKPEFGPTKLTFPVFPNAPYQEFDRLVLDGFNQDRTYPMGGSSVAPFRQMVRDPFSMNLQLAMEGETSRNRYVHVFINGLYWGLYNIHERPDDDWAVEQFGGEDHEYDWIKEGGVHSGNFYPADHPTTPGLWSIVVSIIQSGLGQNDMWKGLPAYEEFKKRVDVENYIDYMILNFWMGNLDWPHQNWMMTARARIGPNLTDVNPNAIFRLHVWDTEDAMHPGVALTAVGDGYYDRTVVSGVESSNIAFPYAKARENPEFRMTFADRAHRHLYHGALYVEPGFDILNTVYDPAHPERNVPASIYYNTALPIFEAIKLQHVRWANYFYTPGYYSMAKWTQERTRLLNQWCAIRSNVLLAQLKNANLYPLTAAPVFSSYGGFVAPGHQLVLTSPSGAPIYYTNDGSDPRLPGGNVSSSAILYNSPISITSSAAIRARCFTGAEWSAIDQGEFTVEYHLKISEFLASNVAGATDEAGDLEDWIELYNASPTSLNLTNLYLSDNPGNLLKWPLPAGTTIPAGGNLLIWCDEEAGEGPFHANFKLSKSGENIIATLVTPSGNYTIDSIAFGAQQNDISQGRIPESGSMLFHLLDPSPDAPNIPAAGASIRYDGLSLPATPGSLKLLSPPMIGNSLLQQIDSVPPFSAGGVFYGTEPNSIAISGIGHFLIDINTIIEPFNNYVANASGTAFTSILIPNDAVLVGQVFIAQALTSGAGMTNAVVLRIGS